MGLKKFLSRIVGYSSELQDASHIGVRPGDVVQSKQALQTIETPKVVQEVLGQFDAMQSPSNKPIEPILTEKLKVEEVSKVIIETKPTKVAPQPVAEPIKASGSRPRGRPRTNGESALPRSKVNGTKSVNSAEASPKPRRTRKMASKGGVTEAPTEPQQTETALGEKKQEKEKMAAPVLQGI
jgi:hypothetical protein